MKLLLSLFAAAACFAQSPTPQPEPAAVTYDVSQLNLFPTYTRASYKALAGVDAPAFDLTKPPKNWFDATQKCAPGASATYQSLVQFSEVPFTISACDAASVNLPPDVQPTIPPPLAVAADGVRFGGLVDLDAWLQGIVSQAEIESSTAPLLQSTLIVPSSLAAKIAPAALAYCAMLDGNNQIFRGGTDPACADPSAAIAKYVASITAWATAAAAVETEMGGVNGAPCLFCAAVARAPVPMPVRPLYPDERVQIAGMMGGVLVMRVPAAPVISASDGFTASDRASAAQILAILKSLTGQ